MKIANRFLLLIVFLFLCLAIACNIKYDLPIEETIPDGAIVFVPKGKANNRVEYFQLWENKPHSLRVKTNLTKFTWIESENSFLSLSWHNSRITGGVLTFWGPEVGSNYPIGESLPGENYSIVGFTRNEKLIFIQNQRSIKLVSIGDEVKIVPIKDAFDQESIGYSGISFSSEENCLYVGVLPNYLEYTPSDSVMKYCLDTDTWEMVANGREPEISPDSCKLALTRDDGLFVRDLKSGMEQLVLEMDFGQENEVHVAHPRWSADGQKIALHGWDGVDELGYSKAVILFIDLQNRMVTNTGFEGYYPSFKGD